ncbi:hypothetical protein CXG81DRAFT_10663, partial [Caulochytrium protostelioides]
LQDIADSNPKYGGSRSIVNGANATAEWVYGMLKNHTDYDVAYQPFNISMFRDVEKPHLASAKRTYIPEENFLTIYNSGSGHLEQVHARVIPGGCAAEDFDQFQKGEIALLSREGPCTYRDIITQAIKQGAGAVVLYTTLQNAGPPGGRCVDCASVPVIAIDHGTAIDLLEQIASSKDGITLTIRTNTTQDTVTSLNVVATTRHGSDDHVIVGGAHLDSVPNGPGINDDASGSATTLELAIQFHKLGLDKKLKNKVRWAWWSGEELGLLGSHHYVEDLYANDPEALKKIKISLDWDMIGSPNYIRGIYNGHEAQNPDLRGPSGRIQDLLAEWFHSHDLATTWVEFDGRSDYGPFLNRGIPCGGVFTGAEVIKTEEQRDVFGGMANVAFDPCYHQHCDSLGNVWGPGLDVLEQNARALAYVMQKFAYEEDLDAWLKGDVPLVAAPIV